MMSFYNPLGIYVVKSKYWKFDLAEQVTVWKIL